MRIFPTNGAVIVTMDSRGPDDKHAFGTVLSHGGGVPWLKEGSYIAYLIHDATRIEVDGDWYADCWRNIDPKLGSSADGLVSVYLVDQRSVHGTITSR